MKGDFSRDTFDPRRHYRGVRMQQGRVQTDADWNEQVDIEARRTETAVRDLVGLCGGPKGEAGFGVVTHPGELDPRLRRALERSRLLPLSEGDFLIAPGRYYVDGILCENEAFVTYLAQPHLPSAPAIGRGRRLVHLDVWHRHITWVQEPDLREVALGGPDSATREQTVWQVRALPLAGADRAAGCDAEPGEWRALAAWPGGQMRARVHPTGWSGPPSSGGYRGLENCLYRVEIHGSGSAGEATFKWSRDNGAMVAPVRAIERSTVRVDLTGIEAGRLRAGSWVEVADDATDLRGLAEPLLEVTGVDAQAGTVTLAAPPRRTPDPTYHPLLRWWDQPLTEETRRLFGGLAVLEGRWLDLEAGVQVRFERGEPDAAYRTGDYWQIPARTAAGDVMWPDEQGTPAALPPRGIAHHRCRLAVVERTRAGLVRVADCRAVFEPIARPVSS